MAYYSALITAWNNASLASGATLPAGVTGSLLTGLTTAQKEAAVNAWTLPSPKPAILTPSAILNAIVPADLAALTTAQVTLLTLCLQGSTVDASKNTTIRAAIQAIFSGKTTTLSQLNALVAPYDNATMLWVTATIAQGGAGLSSTVTDADLTAAGGLT